MVTNTAQSVRGVFLVQVAGGVGDEINTIDLGGGHPMRRFRESIDFKCKPISIVHEILR